MNRLLKFTTLSLSLAASLFLLTAANQQDAEAEKKEKPKIEGAQAYFFDDTPITGIVDRDKVAEALKHPLIVKDKKGTTYQVVFYKYTYAELGMFADEAGNPILITDYKTTYGREGMISELYIDYFDAHAGYGDTLYIDNVQYLLPDSTLAEDFAKGIKIAIDGGF